MVFAGFPKMGLVECSETETLPWGVSESRFGSNKILFCVLTQCECSFFGCGIGRILDLLARILK